MDEQLKRKRPPYSDEFKRDAVRLVVEEGYSFKSACEAVEVCDATLRGWHRRLVPPPEPCGEDATADELKAENKRLRKQLKRAERTAKIRESVRRVFDENHAIYGPAKIAEALGQRDELETACRNTVARAITDSGLKSRVCKAFTPTTTQADPSKRPAPNVLNRDFTAERPNQKWVTDITYLPTAAGWVYLATVVDLFSRKVVGWAMSDSLATPLVSEALRKAIESRRPERGELLHHSDRGSQYTSDDYRKTLKTLRVECSMSRRGDCYDNAVAERFFWSLKHEWTKHESFADLEEARRSVFTYIDLFYNRQRLHQSLGYKTPEQYEAENAPAGPVAGIKQPLFCKSRVSAFQERFIRRPC